jgi:DNA-directed RNA polymerase specialized sigma24 family protein
VNHNGTSQRSTLYKLNLETAFQDLEDTYTIPFLMYFLGYQPRDIAKILKEPTDSIDKRILHAQLELRKKFLNIHT